MVYLSRWDPSVVPTSAPTPVPPVVIRSPAPVLWDKETQFLIGQLTAAGHYNFTASDLETIVDVQDMTAEQLVQAADEIKRQLKNLSLFEQEYALMQRIANEASTPQEYHKNFADEPFLMMRETPPGDPLCSPDYDTIEKIRAWLKQERDANLVQLAVLRGLRITIGGLGGPLLDPPVEESLLPYEMDKLKEEVKDAIGDIDYAKEHLVPEQGTPVEGEEIPLPWPSPIPDYPTDPVWPSDNSNAQLYGAVLSIMEYLRHEKAYYLPVLFNMCWCLEQIRVCLLSLDAANAPGNQMGGFATGLEAISKGMIELESAGVFAD